MPVPLVNLARRDDPKYVQEWWAEFEAEESICRELGLPLPIPPYNAPGWDLDEDQDEAVPVALATPALDASTMDEAQRRVVEHKTGPALVMAGAGAGKTRTIVARVVRMLERGTPPSEILCLTFTRRAANEMRNRIGQQVGSAAKKITVSTFHALALDLLRSQPLVAERQANFSVWDEGIQKKEIRTIIKNHTLAKGVDRGEWILAGDVCAMLDTVKEQGETIPGKMFHLKMSGLHRQAWEVALDYEQLKKDCNALDFADLVWRVATGLLAPESPTKVSIRRRWTSIIVDEYQDTNAVQELLLERLCEEHHNLMAVGDEDQAIYAFRGSNVDYIRSFALRYEGAVTYLLGRNYRSTPEIVQSANALISQNKRRNFKKVWSEANPGTPIRTGVFTTPNEEARQVASGIAAAQSTGVADGEIAVLVRTRMQFLPLQMELQRLKIPFYVVGDSAWYTRSDAKVVLAWMRGVLNTQDLDAGATALASWDGLGSGTITLWRSEMTSLNAPMFSRLAFLHSQKGLGTHTQRGQRLADFARAWSRWEEGTRSSDLGLQTRVNTLFTDLGIHEEIVTAKLSGKPGEANEANNRHRFLASLLQSMPDTPGSGGWKGMQHWLDELFVNAKLDQNTRDGVCLSTIHGSKGLEWSHVWLPGWSMGLFPSDRSTLGESLEEERRLAYVAVTRARTQLTVSWFRTSFIPEPRDYTRSNFLDELDPERVRDASWTIQEALPIRPPTPTPRPTTTTSDWVNPTWLVNTMGEASPSIDDEDQPQHPSWTGWDTPMELTLSEVTVHTSENTLKCITCGRSVRVSVVFDLKGDGLPSQILVGRRCAARLLGAWAVFDAVVAAKVLGVALNDPDDLRGAFLIKSQPPEATLLISASPIPPSLHGTQTSLFGATSILEPA